MQCDQPLTLIKSEDASRTTSRIAADTVPHQHDRDYYLQDVIILVESTLFRIHRLFLGQSSVLLRLLNDAPLELGSSDRSPLQLGGCTADEARQFLRALIPLTPGQVPALTPADCLSVLKVATEWKFDVVRANILDHMRAYVVQDPILRIIAAVQYSVSDWLIPGVNALAQREGPLTEEDVDRLDVFPDQRQARKLLLKIHAVRECFRGGTAETRSSFDFTPHICEIFGLQRPRTTDEDQQTAVVMTDVEDQPSEPNESTTSDPDSVQKRKQVAGGESPRKRARNSEPEAPSLLARLAGNISEVDFNIMSVDIDNLGQLPGQIPCSSKIHANNPVSVHDYSEFASRCMPDLGYQVKGFKGFTWRIDTWSSLRGRCISETFECAGHSWRIILHPNGDHSVVTNDAVSLHLERVPSAGHPESCAWAQYGLFLSNRENPLIRKGRMARARRRFDSRFDSSEANWGWARVDTLENLLIGQGLKSPIIVGDAVDITAYVRVVEDPPGE